MDLVTDLLRWGHIVAGLFFVGLSWWFNLAFVPSSLSSDPETQKKNMLELVPRAVYWFRWAALYTVVLGAALLAIIFYDGGLTIEGQQAWTTGSYIMVVVVFLVYRLYAVLAKTPLGKNLLLFASVGFLIIAAIIYCMIEFGHFSYRGYVIHTG
ncbi:MAG TPA: urate hydroxylase PuuD, partial [Bacteroidota bacterium]|nr:urate hydroxylase PuuD [Bacteroidota bacterium]